MNTAVIVLRVLHILCGVAWAGAVFFIAAFLEPVVRTVGPAGGAVMMGIQKRGFSNFTAVMAVVTVLAGGTLLWIDSNGFSPAWMRTATGMGFSTGGLFGVLALGVGLGMMKPATERMGKLGAQMAQIPEGPARAAHMATMAAEGQRIKFAARLLAGLMLVAVLAMAASRYLG